MLELHNEKQLKYFVILPFSTTVVHRLKLTILHSFKLVYTIAQTSYLIIFFTSAFSKNNFIFLQIFRLFLKSQQTERFLSCFFGITQRKTKEYENVFLKKFTVAPMPLTYN